MRRPHRWTIRTRPCSAMPSRCDRPIRAISAAIADLAARPLDVAAAEQMRRALHAPNLVTARRALDRLGASSRTRSAAHLSVVTDRPPDAELLTSSSAGSGTSRCRGPHGRRRGVKTPTLRRAATRPAPVLDPVTADTATAEHGDQGDLASGTSGSRLAARAWTVVLWTALAGGLVALVGVRAAATSAPPAATPTTATDAAASDQAAAGEFAQQLVLGWLQSTRGHEDRLSRFVDTTALDAARHGRDGDSTGHGQHRQRRSQHLVGHGRRVGSDRSRWNGPSVLSGSRRRSRQPAA